MDRYLREARALIARRDASDVAAAVGLLDAALAVAPRLEAALELRARSLLALRRYRDVAEMLEEYMPSYRGGAGAGDDDSSGGSLGGGGGGSSGEQSSRAKLLSPERERSDLGGGGGGGSFRCFSVSDLKRRVLAGFSRNDHREGLWRYYLQFTPSNVSLLTLLGPPTALFIAIYDSSREKQNIDFP